MPFAFALTSACRVQLAQTASDGIRGSDGPGVQGTDAACESRRDVVLRREVFRRETLGNEGFWWSTFESSAREISRPVVARKRRAQSKFSPGTPRHSS